MAAVEMSFDFPRFGYPCLSLPNPLPLLRLPLRMTLRGWSFVLLPTVPHHHRFTNRLAWIVTHRSPSAGPRCLSRPLIVA